MDKGLKYINYLKSKLSKLSQGLDEIGNKETEKFDEKRQLEFKIRLLENEKRKYDYNKESFLYIQKNIKKMKRQTITCTTVIFLLLEAFIYFLNICLTKNIEVLAVIVPSLLAIPVSFIYGDIGDYYSNKKYLKKHSIEEIEANISNFENEINLNKNKCDVVNSEIQELLLEKDDLQKQMCSIKEEIKDIEKIRTDIINEFINNNKTLDALLNLGYDLYDEKKAKQLRK